MLSRLKRRTASSSQPPESDRPTVNHDDPPSPTASRRTSTSTNNTPSKQSVHSNRTLSPTRTKHYAPSMSRTSSYGSVNGMDMGNEMGQGSYAGSGIGHGSRVGQGSLTLDHLTPQDGSAPLTLVVQAPELMTESESKQLNSMVMDEEGLATPMPGKPVELRLADGTVLTSSSNSNTADSNSKAPMANPSTISALHSSIPMSRPRAHTTSEAIQQHSSRSPVPRSQTSSVSTILPTKSGLDALAQINSPTGQSFPSNDYLGAHSQSSSVPTSPPSHSRPHSRSVSRPASRSPSFNAQTQTRPDSHSLHPPTVSPTRSRRNTKSSGGSSGIAGAIALSGVALASPSSQLRHPLGLARGSSHAPSNSTVDTNAPPTSPSLNATTYSSESQGNTSGRRSTASSVHNGVTPVRSRESIDSNAPISPPDSRRDSEVYNSPVLSSQASTSMMNLNDQGFLSMDQLGDFDDVVSQLGTGYAVASSKRNADFHALFKNISDDDYLIEDYGCALQREILIQGRLYISEHHLSFNANIFGWVTSLTIPFAEVCSIEKRMTAYVIPNAIQISTMHARHTFASFLSRDTTYDLIGNIWRMVHPVVPTSAGLPDHSPSGSEDEGGPSNGVGEDTGMTSGVEKDSRDGGREGRGVRKRLRGFRRPRGGTGESSNAGGSKVIAEASEPSNGSAGGGGGGGSGNNSARPGSPNGGGKRHAHPVTKDTCPTLKNLKEVCMDTIFPSAPEKIYNLMFTSGFMKDFWTENQKLLDLQIGDWAPQSTGSNLLARSFSYIKPLNGSIGPRQTKCMITDESAHVDFDDFVCVVTTTRTPDVPSGSAFAVKTRTSMTWAKGNSCRVIVTTGVEWSKSSFIKGIIEKSCIDGQKTYHNDLEKAMRSYITTHRNEFIEEGHSEDAEDEDASSRAANGTVDDEDGDDSGSLAGSTSKDDRNRTWATPLLESLEPIVEVISEQSLKTLAFGFVLLVLVLSNLWTLTSGRGKEASLSPSERGRLRNTNGGGTSPRGELDTRTPDEVASAVRDVLQDYFKQQVKNDPPALPPATETITGSNRDSRAWKEEVAEVGKVLDQMEERIRRLRRSLVEVD